jgi:hypothetical protein
MDPQDELPDRPVRPPPSRLPYVALQERAGRLGRAVSARLSAVPDNVRQLDGNRSTSFVPDSDTVVIDVRRHAFLLVWPLLRTLFGLVVLLVGSMLLPVALFTLVTGVWARVRFGTGGRKTVGAAVLGTAALIVLPTLTGAVLSALLLLAWAAEDVADWWCDRLVVTDRRIYRRYGVFTRHSPSIALTAIAFIDGAVPPIGHLLHYGTLRLDSVAQRDAPLARMDLIPDVTSVSHRILQLRMKAMPTFPMQPY